MPQRDACILTNLNPVDLWTRSVFEAQGKAATYAHNCLLVQTYAWTGRLSGWQQTFGSAKQVNLSTMGQKLQR